MEKDNININNFRRTNVESRYIGTFLLNRWPMVWVRVSLIMYGMHYMKNEVMAVILH